MLQSVEHLVKAGFAIHRLHPRSKRPIGEDWQTKAVLTFERLKATYRAGDNLGVRLGQWSKVGDYFLHVLDLDIRDESLAAQARDKLTELFPDWRTFPIVASGSGGESRHVYLLSSKHFPSRKLAHGETKIEDADGKKHWSWEIELFGTGKQVAIPPSIHPDTGKPYRWLQQFDFSDLDLGFGPIVPASRLEALIGSDDSSIEPDDERLAPVGLTVDEVRELLNQLPNDDSDYDDWLNVMASVQHEAFSRSKSEKAAFFEVFRAWSARSKKHDDKTTKYKFYSFKNRTDRRHRTMRSVMAEVQQIALDAEIDNLGDESDDLIVDDLGEDVEDQFDDLLGNGKPEVSKRQQKLNKGKVEHALGHVPPKIARINRKHAVAFINGKTTIITENADTSVSYGTVGDLHNFYENDRVATEKATEPVTKFWLRHKARREYPNGVVFAPCEDVPGAYNHWRGYAVEADSKASCKLILRHIRKILCKDDEAANRYFLGWLAHMIQRPWEKPGVAVVLRGAKGAGKDTIGDYVGGLFPHHHVKVANQEHMVGRFNAHQEKCLMLHVEEGFWAGNKQADGALKHLITSEKVFIEPKGLNGFHVKSVLRLFMSSNERWVVPATGDERRYFVLDVSDRYSVKKSTADERDRYFGAIRDEMLNGGREALLHYLQTYDISKFKVRSAPNTSALADQKVQGLRNFERWWFNMLQNGTTEFPAYTIGGSREGVWLKEPIVVDCVELQEAYGRWMRTRRFDGDELQDFEIGKHLRGLLPSCRISKPRRDGKQVRSYIFPDLNEARSEFEAWIGSQLNWPEEEEIVEEPEYDDLD